MRRIALFAALLAAGCTPTPDVQQPRPAPAPPSPIVPRQSNSLIGLTAAELVQQLGSPALQIREGQSLKLQFRSPACILDAYLYRSVSGQGVERVAHVDARRRTGAEMDQRLCIAAMGSG